MILTKRLILASLLIESVSCTASTSTLQRDVQKVSGTADDNRHVAVCRRSAEDRDCFRSSEVRTRRRWFGKNKLAEVRGGSDVPAPQACSERQEPREVKVVVSTAKISSYVDVRGEVTARSDWTIARLREELEHKLPGNMPASVQRLFKGTQLLPSSMILEEATEGVEGPLSLLLENAPPIDATRFDPDTAVPSSKGAQVEAFSACLAAQSYLQDTLFATMRGKYIQDDPELTRSVTMKADFVNTKAFLSRTLQEMPDSAEAEAPQSFGILHEALRPIVRSLDIKWILSAQHVLFVYLCAQYGARGALRRALTLLVIPLIFLAQTRTVRVGIKVMRNLAAEIPIVTQMILGVLTAPGQVILSLNEQDYVNELYGAGGPKIEFSEHGRDSDEIGEALEETSDRSKVYRG